jgi:uncharacterized protein YidB (DUF937 family)
MNEPSLKTVGAMPDADMTTVVGHVIHRYGGIGGLMTRFAQVGLRSTIKAWVIPGSNRPVTAEQIQQAVGPPLVCELAAKLGISPQALAIRLAYILPSAIDALTTNGRVARHQNAVGD